MQQAQPACRSRSQPAGGGGNGGGAPARKPEAALCAKPPAVEVASCVYRTAHRRSRPSVCGAALANRPALTLASPAPRVPRNDGRWPTEHRRQRPVGIWGRSGGRPPSAAGRGRRRAAGDVRNRAPLLARTSSQLVALGKMGPMLPPLLPLEDAATKGPPSDVELDARRQGHANSRQAAAVGGHAARHKCSSRLASCHKRSTPANGKPNQAHPVDLTHHQSPSLASMPFLPSCPFLPPATLCPGQA